MGDLQADDILGDERCVPGARVDTLVDIEADPGFSVIHVYHLEMCLQRVIRSGDEWVSPWLLNGKNVVLGDPAVLEQTRQDDVS